MNFRYTIYNRVSGLYMKNECKAANEKMLVITLLETMVPLMRWVMKYDCFNPARIKLLETFVTGHIRILSREDYNLPVNL